MINFQHAEVHELKKTDIKRISERAIKNLEYISSIARDYLHLQYRRKSELSKLLYAKTFKASKQIYAFLQAIYLYYLSKKALAEADIKWEKIKKISAFWVETSDGKCRGLAEIHFTSEFRVTIEKFQRHLFEITVIAPKGKEFIETGYFGSPALSVNRLNSMQFHQSYYSFVVYLYHLNLATSMGLPVQSSHRDIQV